MFSLTTSALLLQALSGVSTAIDLRWAADGGNKTDPHQYGIMFEDINYSGDGGVYAELIRNRAFQGSTEIPKTIDPWAAVNGAVLSLKDVVPPVSSVLTSSLNVALSNGTNGLIGFSNPGYWGIDVKAEDYQGSFWVKGAYKGVFKASLQSSLTDDVFGSVDVESKSAPDVWTEHKFTLTPEKTAPNSNNTFSITFDPAGVSGGSLDFNIISLFPPTYNNRPNGNRRDLMEKMADMKPSFLRFPGGNNLEGIHPPNHWKWNETLGDFTARPGRPGTWTYTNTDGLGLLEYLDWCEDLKVEPFLGIFAGLYLDGTVIPPEDLDVYVEDAMNELEFLMGDESTEWGAKRVAMGRPEPYNIRYVEVGNEDMLWGGLDSYRDYRFKAFYDAIHAKYPDMIVIASTIEIPLEGDNVYGDWHTYEKPDQLVAWFNLWDQSSPDHKIFVGEYAALKYNDGSTAPYPYWQGTVGEAVFTVGTERNAHGILGVAYAPGFQNINEWQWIPDLITFSADPSQTVVSTSYHMLALLSNARATATLPLTDGSVAQFGPSYYVGGVNEDRGTRIMKGAVYGAAAPETFNVAFEGVAEGATATLTVLTSTAGPMAMNEFGKEDIVRTDTTTLTAGADGVFTFEAPDLSVFVLETVAA